mgnify:CR=1 FL=1
MIALCLGGARSVWEDLERARALVGDAPALVVACNFAGIAYEGRLDAWVTLHPEMCAPWRAERAGRGLNTDYRFFMHKARRGVSAEILPQGWYGSSGLYMAQVALERLGCAGAILCGVPMAAEDGHIHWPGPWTEFARYRPGFLAAQAEGAEIRAMSGWTAEALGQPDAAWLASLGGGRMVSPPAPEPQPQRVPLQGWPAQIERTEVMHIEVLRDRILTLPGRRASVKFKAGWAGATKRAWGDQLVADGDAVELGAPTRPQAEAEVEAGASTESAA